MDSVDPPSKWVTLQWGRNFIVAEMRLRALRVRFSVQGFNGAATLSLRKSGMNAIARTLHEALQWGRNFIVAEIYQQKLQYALESELQWGRNFIVAEMYHIQYQGPTASVLASMGPQLYRCGNMRREKEIRHGHLCFNGAATLSLRKYGIRYHTCANPAMASMGPQLYRCGNATSPP